MSTKRESLAMPADAWLKLQQVAEAAKTVSPKSRRPSWRHMMRQIADGSLTVVATQRPIEVDLAGQGNRMTLADVR